MNNEVPDRIDCEQVKKCLERLFWELEKLAEENQQRDQLLKRVADQEAKTNILLKQVRASIVGGLVVAVAYVLGFAELLKAIF